MKRTQEDTRPLSRPRGRPRSDSVDRALSRAALEEFKERGYRDMSMGSIAARAGVSKVSLYRRWASKPAVVADVLRLMSETHRPRDEGSLKADVRSLLSESIGSSGARSAARVLMRTMGEISGHPELLALYREQLLAPRLEQMRLLVERARTRGELRPGLSIDVAVMMIAGPLFLYFLNLLAEAETDLPPNLPEALTRFILEGISL